MYTDSDLGFSEYFSHSIANGSYTWIAPNLLQIRKKHFMDDLEFRKIESANIFEAFFDAMCSDLGSDCFKLRRTGEKASRCDCWKA